MAHSIERAGKKTSRPLVQSRTAGAEQKKATGQSLSLVLLSLPQQKAIAAGHCGVRFFWHARLGRRVFFYRRL